MLYDKFQSLIGMLKTPAAPTPPAGAKRVSIPHRYAENDVGRHHSGIQYLFQSLIGMLKTAPDIGRPILKNLVSIPHRYAENKTQHSVGKSTPRKFQSLIGMLKTLKGKPVVKCRSGKFQSLIGMLKTGGIFPQSGRILRFQSLIGMLKTNLNERIFTCQCFVSIPHRYAENSITWVAVSCRLI